MNVEKWKKSVVHLECAGNSFDHSASSDIRNRLDKAHEDRRNGIISEEELKLHMQGYAQQISLGTRDQRFHGTAIFLEHNGNHYLVTAKHVVFDKLESSREHNRSNGNAERVFDIIFRIRSIDEVKRITYEVLPNPNLMNLNAGAPFFLSFTFSNSDLDLAIISLHRRGSSAEFAEDLIKHGYIPITVDDIAEGPLIEGQEVFTVGYPEATSVIGNIGLHSALTKWASSVFSAPVFSFGKVSMRSEHLDFFWADMSVYPGNSGGPVIADDKLVGIVSAQAVTDVDRYVDESQDETEKEKYKDQLVTGIPFGKIINARHVLNLLSVRAEQDGRLYS